MGIKKVLVANRGEIARRVFRTCRELGIATVAVFSDPDANEPHSSEADEAVRLPGASPADTYLNGDAILGAAKATGADAIHPGYGFLSENASFARSVESADLIWIGPPPEAIEVMGSKIESKQIVTAIDIPTLPTIELAGLSTVRSAALSIGFPLLVKASGGGGGKGMRLVHTGDMLREEIDAARREAKSAFGDDRVFLEKYLTLARHIEVQVFADKHQNVIALFERECSIQRRHQKIIEESPSAALSDRRRRRMSSAAISVAREVGYVGAGTVEFLVDSDDFYFLEMNTRLQVEHPTTEMVTGLDLVELQIRVAEGEPLPPEAIDCSLSGHAIEARLYAEDPAAGFLPATGPLHRFEIDSSPELRVDSGVESGSELTVHYDPMMAKVIAHSTTREGAAAKLATALRSARIHGPVNNLSLLVRILESDEFAAGETFTNFLDRHDIDSWSGPLLDEHDEERAVMAAALADQAHRRESAEVLTSVPSGWRIMRDRAQRVSYQGKHRLYEIGYLVGAGSARVTGHPEIEISRISPTSADVAFDGDVTSYQVARYGDIRFVNTSDGQTRLVALPRFAEGRAEDEPGSLHAPMPGKVLRVDVSVGDEVIEGQVLLVMEAMKMEHTLKAPHGGTVSSLTCREGDQVEGGATLVVVV